MAASGDEIDIDLAPLAAPTEVLRGRRVLGRYVLCYELASGGMATVYLARSAGTAGFEKMVALKIVHPHLAREREFADMFLDEAKLAARIAHPNVCSVFDFGEAEGTFFLAMEYLAGENVARVTRALAASPARTLDPKTPILIARIVEAACEGLHAAHETKGDDGRLLGVVHRDVTPQNIVVGYDGSVRVVDFGVASSTGHRQASETGTLKGKYPYMSPEQVNRHPLDRRSDVWSLGVCLWEMLTRRRLFRRDGELETLTAILKDPIAPPSSVRRGLPPALDAIVMRALARDPKARYATAREMGRALNAVIGATSGTSAADLAELMEKLFASEREASDRLIERARRIDPDGGSVSGVKHAVPGGPRVAMPDGTVARRGRIARKWIAIGAVIVGALVGATLVALVVPGGETATEGVAEGAGVAVAEPVAEPEPAPATAADPAPAPATAADPAPAPATAADPEPDPARASDSERETERERDRDRERDRRRDEAPGDRAARGTGTVAVVTPPGWAEIYVGGRQVGRSPAEISLPSGAQTLRLVPYGDGAPIVRRVNVPANGTTRLVVRLEP